MVGDGGLLEFGVRVVQRFCGIIFVDDFKEGLLNAGVGCVSTLGFGALLIIVLGEVVRIKHIHHKLLVEVIL